MEILLVLAICFLVLALNCLPFIIGFLATPANSVYLGTVHWAGDYFSYLSQMAQGRYNFLFARNLYNAEKLPEVLIGWQMVIVGKVFTVLGISVIYGYQIAVVIFIFIFLLLAYKLIAILFPKERMKRLLAFFFFATGTAFFKVTVGKSGLAWSFYDYWYNTGNALTRFEQTPHHAIANSLSLAMVLLIFCWIKGKINLIKQVGVIVGSISLGVALCSITPVYWVLVGGGLGLAIVAYNFLRDRLRHPLTTIKTIIRQSLPLFFYTLAGIPMALYLREIFSHPPYIDGAVWEATQQLPASFYLILVGSGLVIPLSFLGAYNFFKKVSFPKVFGTTFILFCALFFFTPIPVNLHLTNARFWPATIYIFIAALATEGVYFLAGIFKKYQKAALIFLLIIYVISVIPTYIVQLSEKTKPKVGNAYVYLPRDMITAYEMAEKISDRDSLFLVQWPMNLSFPALTGRRAFHGYDLLTIDYATRDREAYEFFAENFNEGQMEAFLDKYHIDYTIGYWWNPKLDKFGRLKRVYSNSTMAIDKVIR